jgi:hypothetical protein
MGNMAIDSWAYYKAYVITPSIEYNINASQGLIAGGYITVSGRNTYKIINAVLSYEVTF